MNKQESIEKIKTTLSELKQLALSLKGKKEEVKLEDIKCDDGTLLTINGDLAVGVEVMTKDAEGNTTPVNDGDYNYQGQKITVLSGKVDKIEEIKVEETVESPDDNANVNMEEVKTEEKLEDVIEDEVKEEEKTDGEVVEEEKTEEKMSIDQRVQMLEEGMGKILAVLDQVLSKTEATLTENTELEKKVTELSAEPGDVSVEEKIKKAPVKLSEVELRIERFKNMAKSL